MAVEVSTFKDAFGLGWRPEYAAEILFNLDKIDIVEVIAENFLHNRQSAKALRTLSAQVPVALHAVSLGLASSLPVERKRLENLARLMDAFTPHSWSEHFSFVRAGGYEIGHLAAPPRNDETIEGAVRNIQVAIETIGLPPSLENIATLITPPLSNYSEWEWISRILQKTSCGFLLDLHNLFSNCSNFDEDPIKVLKQLPLEKVNLVHLSGGKWIEDPQDKNKRYLLDDHLHDVPKDVFHLLSLLAERCPNSLTVLIERDGNYPQFQSILEQLQKARHAVAMGRQKREEKARKEKSHVNG